MEYLDFAIELARSAGDVLKHYMGRDKQVELKGQANLVTVARALAAQGGRAIVG